MYEKYFLDIVKTINERMHPYRDARPCVSIGVGLFAWAQDHAPELYAQERVLDEEMNILWNNTPPTPSQEGSKNFEAFKAKVLAWGRVVLQIYKKFSEKNHVRIS